VSRIASPHRDVDGSALPNATRWYRHYLPVFPFAIEQFDLDDVDQDPTSHCAAKPWCRRAAPAICATATRRCATRDQLTRIWVPLPGRWKSTLARHVMARMARWDRDTAHRVDVFRQLAARCRANRAHYNRRQRCCPPVDTAFSRPMVAARV
jgi:hypothetical protein